jgi:hypothetical protein
MDSGGHFASVHGFTYENGRALQLFLTDQLNRQVFVAPTPEKNVQTGEKTRFRQFVPKQDPSARR